MFGNSCDGKLELDDLKVLFPEDYSEDDKDMLIAKLHDRDRIIEALWFEVKGYRELEKEGNIT